ncbi:MAG TPA: NHL repeat-containing protein [Patescibacteria group bacterium]|nr:NHL repeat-containing protein [Patescibacteria group bacterium]
MNTEIPTLILTFLLSFGNFQLGAGITADATGNIYVSDAGYGKVLQLTPRGDLLRVAGASGWGDVAFDEPRGLAASFSNGVLVADMNNHRVQIFQRDMSFVSSLFTRTSDNEKERFGLPSDVAVLRNGDMLVCDTENTRIVQFSSGGEYRRTFGEFDAGVGRLKAPKSIAVTSDDHVYVLDGLTEIAHFDNFGNYIGTLQNASRNPVSAIFTQNRIVFAISDSIVYLLKNSLEFTEVRIPQQFAQQWQDGCIFQNTLYLLGRKNVIAFKLEEISTSLD